MTWLNWPNRITVARIFLVAPFVICLLNLQDEWPYWRQVALVVFILMAVSDALDGFLARRLGEETAIGRFLDPVGDKLLITSAVVLLAIEGTSVPGFLLPSWVTVVAISKDLLTVIGFGLIYATTGQFFIKPRILGKSCTLIQCVMVGYCLAGPDLPWNAGGIWPALYSLSSIAALLAVIDYLTLGSRFVSRWQAEHASGTGGDANDK
jgi:cardiolipin synthase